MTWDLPKEATFGGKTYPHRWDFREILKLLRVFDRQEQPPLLRWYTALHYFFYGADVPEREAMAYLSQFVNAGQDPAPGPRLYDWDFDAQLIAAGVNAVAGRELREDPALHWWTFLGYFRAMGPGEFSTVVAIRDKLRRGKKLEDYEQDFYRMNSKLIKLPTPDPQKQRLIHMLDTL